jgi:proline iminopeptidase
MNPDYYTLQELMLDVGDGHEIYIQDWGNKHAKTPVLFLHGGPGSGLSDSHKRHFNPLKHRVIFFDQRGSGKSTPYGDLEHNATQDLVKDIEKIADKLELNTFIISAASWGACLGLVYAIEHPERVSAMVLRGIFTGTKTELDWVKEGRYRQFFPEVWAHVLENTPKEHRQRAGDYHFERILGDDKNAAAVSAITLQNAVGAIYALDDRFWPLSLRDEYDPNSMRIEAHYTVNNCFLPDNYIMEHAPSLQMPVYLIHGRYDMICPPITAWALDQKLPNSKLFWTMANHANDRSNYDVHHTLLSQILEG